VSVIPEEDRELLREIFAEKMQKDVEVLLFTRRGDSSSTEAVRLLEDVSSLSPKISLRVYDFDRDRDVAVEHGIARAPAVTIRGGRDYGIRYYGVPFEQEFETLVEWLISVSRGRAGLSPETLRELRELRDEKKLTVLVTYACPQCPEVAQRVIDFAVASEKINVDIIDIFEFPEVKKDFPVLVSTPKIFAGDKTLTGWRGSDEAALLELIK
jgi:glutaredoxin-like protein